ncbi:MAG: phage/plasmid primase, P4 family [Candidatus Dojkabacteria bacterium]|nr:phage/plasmid primase, P4 family [Candidatus Dojkabacteria bacterium]
MENIKSYEEEISNLDSKNRNEFIKNLIDNIVIHIRTKFYSKTMMDNDEMFVYFDGYYHENGDKYIRSMCDKIFGKHYNGVIWKSILDKVKPQTLPRKFFIEPNNKINLKNGVLDINTLKLEPHNPDYNFLYKININYNECANCPEIKKFIREAVENDEDFLCLQEYIGYTLYPEYKYDKFVIIHGEGGHNRKSKVFSLITKMLGGSDNVSSSSLQSLSKDRFECSMLYGKKANICSDITSEKIDLTGEVKRLLGFDYITAQRKHERQFQFVNKAKLMFSCNSLPIISDDTDAWWKKVILLNFSTDFSSDSHDIMNILTTEEEMEGFLNFAVIGLKRLLTKGKFSYDHDMTKERWDDYSSSEKENELDIFKEKIFDLQVGQDNVISRDKLYDLYISNNGDKSFTKAKFTRLMTKYQNVELVKRGSSGKQEKVFINVKLKEKSVKLQIENGKH